MTTGEPAEATPQVRNGRVLAAVLGAALLLLVIPFAIVWLVTGPDDNSSFRIGDCVRQDQDQALRVDCGTAGAFEIVSKVDAKEKCPDPNQPSVVAGDPAKRQVFCLKPRS